MLLLYPFGLYLHPADQQVQVNDYEIKWKNKLRNPKKNISCSTSKINGIKAGAEPGIKLKRGKNIPKQIIEELRRGI